VPIPHAKMNIFQKKFRNFFISFFHLKLLKKLEKVEKNLNLFWEGVKKN
jgi:hypothetical protein